MITAAAGLCSFAAPIGGVASDRFKAKVCLVGDAAVGKTSLVRRFVADTFDDAYQATLAAKVVAKDVAVRSDGDDVAVTMQVWDILGDSAVIERAAEAYFDNVQGVIAVCDLTRYSTFERLPVWLEAVWRVAAEVPLAVAVNKTDLSGEAFTLYDEYAVRQFAEEVGARWYMTSAKTGFNVEPMFARLAGDIVARARARVASPQVD